jgi:hypothetical protein
MKTVKTKKETKEKNWALPGVKLTHEGFVAGIRKAEEGPFYTLEEVQIMRNQWRNSKKNQ